ncbi:MAG: hypothetical protein PHQ22_02705 [Sulfuricurvum sp.]|nr:hypothetical protein [Sulfuricurvum sp.]MDD5386085.1 hypothetical protein [Sulfuricurvum sp.]
MNSNNGISFLLGAALGGVAIYFALKHQDEIIDKIHELEENLNIDHNGLIDNAKGKLDQLTSSLQSTIGRYTHSDDTAEKADEIAAITEELNRLRAEVQALKA